MDKNEKNQINPENNETPVELNETDLEQVDGGLNFSKGAIHSLKIEPENSLSCRRAGGDTHEIIVVC